MFNWIRHWPRHALVIFAVAAAVFAVGCWRTWALIVAKPHPTVDTIAQLDALTLEGQPEGENAWDAYSELFADELDESHLLMRPNERKRVVLASFEASRGEWTDKDRSDLVQWLGEHRHLLQKAASIVVMDRFAAPYSRFIGVYPFGSNWQTTLLVMGDPENEFAGNIFLLSELNRAQLRASAHAADWNDVIARVEFGLQLARQYLNQPTMKDNNRAIGLALLFLIELAQVVNEYEIPIDVCQSIENMLEQTEFDVEQAFGRAISAHSIELVDVIQWGHTRAGLPLITVYDSSIWELNSLTRSSASAILRPWSPGRRAAQRQADARIVHLRNVQSQSVHNLLERRLEQEPLLRHPLFSTISMYSAEGSRKFYLSATSQILAVRAMLLLEIYQQEHGVWPNALTDAMDNDDAIDSVSGDPFEYILAPDDSSGRAYELRIPWSTRYGNHDVANAPRGPLLQSPY